MDGWESIEESGKSYGVFVGEGDDGPQRPLAIFGYEDDAQQYVKFLAALPEGHRPMEPWQVLPMRQVRGEFWNSIRDVFWLEESVNLDD